MGDRTKMLLELVGFHPRVMLLIHGVCMAFYGATIIASTEGWWVTLIGESVLINGAAAIVWMMFPRLGRWWGAGVLAWGLFGIGGRIAFLIISRPEFAPGVWALVAWAAALLYLWPTLAVGMELSLIDRQDN